VNIFIKDKEGFSLVETLVLLTIFMIAGLAFYKSFTVATAYIIESKNRLAATQLANEKMEIIRSLPYDSIGTKKTDGAGGWIMGIPGGNILEFEEVTKNTRTFYVHTLAKYQDDPYDGTALLGTDTRPADFKDVRVQVSWNPDYIETKSAFLVSRFVPPGLEGNSTGGILSVNVQNNQGVPIDDVAVRLTNTNTGIDQTYNTTEGNVTFLEVPEDLNSNYRISISKSGYFSAHTYPVYDVLVPGSFNPIDKDTAITTGTMWTNSITMDEKVELKIQTKDMLGAFVPDVQFSLSGGRELGTENPTSIVKVFSYNQSGLDSGAAGEIIITDPSGLSSGIYNFNPINPVGYEFLKMSSSTNNSNEFYLQPNTDQTESAFFMKTAENSVLVTVLNNADATPLVGATVNIKDAGLTYDLTATTDYSGRAFFVNGSSALNSGDHTILVTASGFSDKSENVNVSGLVKEEIMLDAI